MPEKNPDIYALIWAWLQSKFATHDVAICGVVVAFFVSLLKSFLHDPKDTPKRVLAEACLCSLLVYSVNPLLVYAGLDKSLLIPIGTAIGMFGTSFIRQQMFKYLKSKGKI